MISAEVKKAVLISRSLDWLIGAGYTVVALLTMSVWLYVLSTLAAKVITWFAF